MEIDPNIYYMQMKIAENLNSLKIFNVLTIKQVNTRLGKIFVEFNVNTLIEKNLQREKSSFF